MYNFQYLTNSWTDQQGTPSSEAEWKPAYRNQRKGKHIKPAISVCVYTLGPSFITRAFSYKITRPCGWQGHKPWIPEKFNTPDAWYQNLWGRNIETPEKPYTQKGSRSRQNQTCHPSRTYGGTGLSTFFLNAPLRQVLCHLSGTQPMSRLYSRRWINQLLPNTDLFPLYTSQKF